jgi:hypothetical protein
MSKPYRFAAIAGVLLALFTGPLFAQENGDVPAVPAEFLTAVIRALNTADENRDTLIAVCSDLEGPEREGWAFLVANMPDRDLRTISREILSEHIRYAYIARQEFSWTRSLSKELFHHYVLPFRSSQEPLEAWRKFFYEELKPALNAMKGKSLTEVALAVNRYCGANVKFKRTSAKDQSPLDTHKKGFGRCEEEMIYFNAVARSAGLPSRSVSTPFWPFQDNNHAWCEVYTGEETREGAKGWHYLGACEPADRLDKAWFTRVVGRAALVTTTVMGLPRGEVPLRYRNRYAVINTTPVYAKTCRLDVKVTGPDGSGIPAAKLYISVFNFNALRPILAVKTDEKGVFSVDIGIGDYVLTAGNGKVWGWALARSRPGQTVVCRIALGEGPPDGYYWLRYPKPGTDYLPKEKRIPDRPVFSDSTDPQGRAILRILVKPPESGKIVPFIFSLAPADRVPWPAGRGNMFRIKGNANLAIPPGKYVVQTGRRNPNGDVRLYVNLVHLKKGRTTAITVEGDLPIAEGGALPVAREMKALPKTALPDAKGLRRTYDDVKGKAGTILVYFSMENEPSQRMLPVIRGLAQEAQKMGCNVVGIHEAGTAPADLAQAAKQNGMDLPVLLQDGGETPWARSMGLPWDEEQKTTTGLPAVMVLDFEGKVVLWQEGYDLNIRVKIEAALRILAKRLKKAKKSRKR